MRNTFILNFTDSLSINTSIKEFSFYNQYIFLTCINYYNQLFKTMHFEKIEKIVIYKFMLKYKKSIYCDEICLFAIHWIQIDKLTKNIGEKIKF